MDPEEIERQVAELEERVTFFENGGTDGVLQDWERERAQSLRQSIDQLRRQLSTTPSASTAGADGDECQTDEPNQHELTDRDWVTLRTSFVQAVQIWCNAMRDVVQDFERDVAGADAEPSDVSLAVTIIDGVVSEFVPKQVKVARAVVQPIFQQVTRGLGGSRVTLNTFCENWATRFREYHSDRGAHDTMFQEFREDVEEQCGDSITLEAANRRVAYLQDQLPTDQNIRRALLRSWIDSTEDESALVGDVWDDEAGYFHVTVRRLDVDRWELRNAYLDDTDEQAGVIAMLQSEYRGQRLETLPFPMKIFIHHGIHNQLTKGEKGRSGGFSLETGMQEVLDAWVATSQGHPTTADLTADSVL